MGTFAIPRQMDIIPPGSKMAPKARTIIQYAERGKPYVTTTGRLKRIDEVERVLVMEDKTTVPLDDIISIDECRSPDFTSDL